MILSIAFITRNRKKELLRAIKSCFEDIPNQHEFIIIDNGSTDGTQDAVEKLFLNNSHIYKYKYYEDNLGVAGARNIAFALSDGKYVFFLDDDAEIASKDFWNVVLLFMEKNTQVVAASVDIQEPETGSNLNCAFKYSSSNYTEIVYYCGCAHILRSSFYKKFKRLYPEKLMFGSEEFYPSNLAWKENYVVAEIMEAKVYHYPSIVNRHTGKDRDLDLIVNQYIIKKLCYPDIIQIIVWFMYIIRRVKNGFIGFRWNKLILNKYQSRFLIEDMARMGISEWVTIIRKFGWKMI